MFKTTKAKVIAVVIFCMICISITVGLILYKNIEIDDDKEVEPKDEPTNIITKDVSGIDKKGTYNQNDLKLEEKRITREKAEITYFEIYGLKNKIIQDSINDEIRETALNYYKEDIKDLNEVINVSVRMNKMANYSNVLSIELYYVAKKDDNGDGLYDGFKGLNYDLTTGEKISFEKILFIYASIYALNLSHLISSSSISIPFVLRLNEDSFLHISTIPSLSISREIR